MRFAMINRCLIVSCSALFCTSLFAFPCVLTLGKSRCWNDYAVTVTILNADKNPNVELAKITIPKDGPTWQRKAFTCTPGEKIMYSATFEPTIWEHGKGAVYMAKHLQILPSTPAPDQKAWEVRVCYPTDFAGLPRPAATGNCNCDFKDIPPLPPRL